MNKKFNIEEDNRKWEEFRNSAKSLEDVWYKKDNGEKTIKPLKWLSEDDYNKPEPKWDWSVFFAGICTGLLIAAIILWFRTVC